MISLSITAMLLVAVASAYSASASAIDLNDRFFRASQSARVSMNQVLSVIRRSQACQVGEDPNPSANVVTASNLHVITAEGESRIYLHVTDEKKLKMIPSDVMTDPGYGLASNVISATFTGVLEQDPQTSLRRIVRVTVTLKTQIGDHEIELTGSAAPRRALTY